MSEGLNLNSVDEAEKFVARQQRIGNDVWWNNYDIIFFRADERGMTSTNGAFRNGQWGFLNMSPLLDNGTYEVDWRNVRRNPKRARS